MKTVALALALGGILSLGMIAPASADRVTSSGGHGLAVVWWDDVYPPAVYGPRLRPIEEVQALKAERRPISSLWSGFWGYYR